MTRWRDLVLRLATPISRRPLTVAVVALLIGALGALGLLRFGIDAGQSLLVGSSSSAGQTYASFAQQFGSDPIVLVFTAHNPTAPYLEHNLERLGALEIDLAHDQRVASVLGPGTIAGSLRQAAVSEVSKVLAEYPYFIAETDVLFNSSGLSQQQLQQRLQSDISNATTLLEGYVVKAASDAHNARAAYVQKNGDKVLDSRERAADAAAAADPVPPLWAEYLAGPGNSPNNTAAAQFFARVAASYGDCSDQIATLLQIQPSCQVFFERTLLDLPNCPVIGAGQFCGPKPQWAAILPPPTPGGDSYQIVTIRLKPQYVGDQNALASLRDKLNSELAHGVAADSYTQSLSPASRANLQALGPLAPTECGGATPQQDAACNSAFKDAHLVSVMAGAPLLGHGVVNSMTALLIILFPVALLVMLLLLVGTFRVRGRVWPLLAALAATVLTIGLSLLTGTSITPAVLAGVPVLVGLGVDYAVQLVARYAEERGRGVAASEALGLVLSNTAGATLIAAVSTLVGLAALAVVGGIDWGPLVAVPLVAEFALVLCGGVVLAWLGGLFVALPLAVWSDGRTPIPAGAEESTPNARDQRRLSRTLAIADNWRGVVALAGVLALGGWALLHVVPVQTDVQALVSPSLQELKDINVVQAETGYTNEIDVYLHGNVATGPINSQTGNPLNVEWQCSLASVIRTEHADTVAQATSIGDYVIASGSGSSGSSAAQCAPSSGTPAPSPSPSPSPSASASPSGSPSTGASGPASASPTAARSIAPPAELADDVVAREAAATTTPSPAGSSGAGTPIPTPVTTPSASAAPSPSTSTATQTRFLCDLRLFPLLSRTLVMNIGPDTLPCPAVDEYQQRFLAKDTTPISPDAGRIAIGVHTNSVADQAKLVDALRGDVAGAPNGMTAAPTGLAVLATTAYDNLVNRSYVLNLVPLLLVALALFVIYRSPRRALLPLLPTALAAGWAPLVVLLLGRIPGGVGDTLGSLNPLTVVLGALVVALGTEFGVVLLGRFYEERRRGLDPDAAAGAAVAGVGRAIRVSALTLGAGFAVLAVSGLFPNSLPLVADFGLAVVIDLALAVAAVFYVMLPVAVALERSSPMAATAAAPASAAQPQPARAARARRPRGADSEPAPVATEAAPAVPVEPAPEATTEPAPTGAPVASPRRLPGVSGRRRPQRAEAAETQPEPEAAPPPPRRPGVSGRKRRRR
ncbi:MAG: MMPL family transporter [Candidatus Dormibacteraeota bacterium]|nr:MMPL family transporter [Candidatus Dormibacteraeota bacterium]MBV9525303.1 MMPL family transporter [Candidatus Dormibacteraeota bacterium]